MLKLVCTLPNLANICLHRSTDVNFKEGDKNFFEKKFEKMLLVVHLLFLHDKQLLMEYLFENQQTYADLLLGLTLASDTPTRSVNPCRPIFIRFGISIQRQLDSRFDKTKPVALKIMSCPIQRTRPEFKIESFYTRSRGMKVDCFSIDGFCFSCNTLFETLGCFYDFCPCQKVRPFLKEEIVKR